MIHAWNNSVSHKQRSFNRPLQHFSILKCIVLANTRHVLARGKENPKDLTCCCNSTVFFSFTIPHRVGGPETLKRLPRPWNCLHNTLERTSALAISVLPPSPCRETLKQISRVGQTSMSNGNNNNNKKTRRNYAILSNNLSTHFGMFQSNIYLFVCLLLS